LREHNKHQEQNRTMRWHRDAAVGPDDMRGHVMARFFISTEADQTPEIYFIPMPKEDAMEDGVAVTRETYTGVIEKNAIPLALLDLDRLYDVLVSEKAKLLRMRQEFHQRHEEEKKRNEELSPKDLIELRKLLQCLTW